MRPALFAAFLVGLNLIAASQANACRGIEPSDVRDREADAIVLAQITTVERATEPGWRRWVATAGKRRAVVGSPDQSEFRFADTGPGSCGPGKPSVDEYWILYLKRETQGFRVAEAWPFWWARASEDRRFKRLNAALPLGIVRAPSADEAKIMDLVDQGLLRSEEAKDLSKYTRVYSRSSPSSLRVVFLRSRTPKRLVADISEEGPTSQSCKCKFDTLFIDVEDLRLWNKNRPYEE
jgi:hypothetical protein